VVPPLFTSIDLLVHLPVITELHRLTFTEVQRRYYIDDILKWQI